MRTSSRRTSVPRVDSGRESCANFGDKETATGAGQLGKKSLLIFIEPGESRIGNQHCDAHGGAQFARSGSGFARDEALGDELLQQSGAGGSFVAQCGCARLAMFGKKGQDGVFGLIARNSIPGFAAAESRAAATPRGVME